MEPMNSPAFSMVMPPGTDFVRGDGVRGRLNMDPSPCTQGLGAPTGSGRMKMRMALLRSKPALRWSYEGFFLNEKKGGNER
jgi:hypothetical protein